MSKTIKDIAQSKGYSIHRLALEAKISPSDLYSVLRGERKLFPKWAKRLSEVLEVDVDELFNEVKDDE